MAAPLLHRNVEMRPDRAVSLVLHDALSRTTADVELRVKGSPPVVEVVQEPDPALRDELTERFAGGREAARTPAGALWCDGVAALSRAPTIRAPWGTLDAGDSEAGHGSAPPGWRTKPRVDGAVVTRLAAPRPRFLAMLGGSPEQATRALSQTVADWFPEPPPGAPPTPRARVRVGGVTPPSGSGCFDASRDLFASPAGLPPYWYCWTHPRGTYTARMRIGVLRRVDRRVAGVTVVVDGRVVVRAERTARVGFGTRGRAKLPANDATLDRLAAVVWVAHPTPSAAIDVGADAPGVAIEELLDEIRPRLHRWSRPYVAYLRNVPPSDAADVADPPQARDQIEFVHWEDAPDDELPPLLADPALAESTLARFAELRAAGSAKGWGQEFVPPTVAEDPGVIPLSSWEAERRVQVPMAEAALQAIERIATMPVSEWIRRAAERELGRSDPRWAVPQAEMRPVVDAVVARARRAAPGAIGIAVFGSVVRGEADRGSDVDLWVIVRSERNRVQRDLNDAFDEFRFPRPVGDRYRVQVLVATVAEAMSHAERGEARFLRMLREAVWFERGPEVEELRRLGGTGA